MSEPVRMRNPKEMGDGLAAWMDRYGDAVLRTAYFYLRDRQRAEDVYQEVFLRVYRNRGSLEAMENPKAWVLKIAVNACRDVMRRPWWKKVLLIDSRPRETAESVEQEAVDSETNRELWRSVSELAEPFRTAVLLYYYHELSTKEIGGILNVSEGTIRSRLHRARQMLKENLESEAARHEE